jgi:hypothetical protein
MVGFRQRYSQVPEAIIDSRERLIITSKDSLQQRVLQLLLDLFREGVGAAVPG